MTEQQQIGPITPLGLDLSEPSAGSVSARQLFEGGRRRVLEVRLGAGAVLKRHKATEPITVSCVTGTGRFTAGDDLEHRMDLFAGSLLTLEADIFHEVTAKTAMILLVIKFLDSY
ncbi:MAG: hypothetical protein AB7V18_18745 [Pyrinomonadaceae bacterium]